MNGRLLKAASACSLLLSACAPTDQPEPVEGKPGVIVQRVRVAPAANGSGAFLGMDFLATDARGMALACDDAEVEVQAEVRIGDGDWVQVDSATTRALCGGQAAHDIALVLDNSGSQRAVVDKTAAGARAFARDVLRTGGRVSVVRVSTDAHTLVPLTDNLFEIEAAIDGLEMSNGWTALYDGVRRGGESLGEVLGVDPVRFDDVDTFCREQRGFGVVAFTNGADNNSATERLLGTYDDGINTTLDDLSGLNINSVTTPIHLIGLGRHVDRELMTELADSTGGKFLDVSEADVLPYAFDLLADYRSATTQVCAKLPEAGCGLTTVRLNYTYRDGDDVHQDTREYQTHVPCEPEAPRGRSATVLMTLSNPHIGAEQAHSLVATVLGYVSPQAAPRVLFVLDDNHHNEFSGDPEAIMQMAQAMGVPGDADFMLEPPPGLSPADVEGYDVVWFSNPGWPLDDELTAVTLEGVRAAGRGLVLSGDDISWSMGRAFAMNSLTGLEHRNNGNRTCGKKTDNNRGAKYRVDFDGELNAMGALSGYSFLYGDDIDHTDVVEGAGVDVLAWATLDGEPNCTLRTPVVVVHDPAQDERILP